jgi:hypothetical protein
MSCSIRARAFGAVRFHVLNDDWAASTAAVTWAVVALGHVPMTSLVAGLRTSIRSIVSTRPEPIFRSSRISVLGELAAPE